MRTVSSGEKNGNKPAIRLTAKIFFSPVGGTTPAYPLNPKVTESQVGDGTNTKRSTVTNYPWEEWVTPAICAILGTRLDVSKKGAGQRFWDFSRMMVNSATMERKPRIEIFTFAARRKKKGHRFRGQ